MSEQNESSATPAAADAQPAPAPDTPSGKEVGAQKRLDARRAMQERVRKRDQAAEQPREQGKFASDQQTSAPETTNTEPAAATEKAAAEATPKPEPAAADAAAGDVGEAQEGARPAETSAAEQAAEESFATISLDERSPLFDQGKKELKVPAELERDIRTLANAAVRSREVDEATNQLQQTQTQNMQLQAKLEALQTGREPMDPRIQTMLDELESSDYYGTEVADQVKEAFQAMESQRLTDAESQATQRAEIVQNAQQFMASVKDAAGGAFPAWGNELESHLNPLLQQYGQMIDWENEQRKEQNMPERPPNPDEFMQMARAKYLADPKAQEVAKKRQHETLEQERRRIQAEERKRLAGEEKKRLEDAQQRHSTRPPTPPPTQSQGRAGPPGEEKSVRHGTRQRDIRQRIAERYSQR